MMMRIMLLMMMLMMTMQAFEATTISYCTFGGGRVGISVVNNNN